MAKLPASTKRTRRPTEPGAAPAEGGDLAALAGGDEIGAAELTRRVADNVRHLRKTRGYSLDDLAARSGVSRASLSQIETSKTNPTISILWKIAAGLGVPFAALLGDERVERVRVLLRNDQQVLRSSDGRMESRPLMPAGASPNVEMYELRLAPRGISSSEPHAKGTTETLIVLTGALRLRVADEQHELSAGDAVFFHADIPHVYENPGRIEARYHNVIVYSR